MSALLTPLLDSRVEAICQKGCRAVRADISALEQGQPTPETADLEPDERARVLAELRALMAVYADQCRV